MERQSIVDLVQREVRREGIAPGWWPVTRQWVSLGIAMVGMATGLVGFASARVEARSQREWKLRHLLHEVDEQLRDDNNRSLTDLAELDHDASLRRMQCAKRLLAQAEAIGPNDPRVVVALANWYLFRGSLEVPLGILTALVEENPEDAAGYEALGVVYGRLGRTADARSNLERSVDLDPRRVSAFVNLAETYYDEDVDRSIAILRDALRLTARSDLVHHNLGACLLRAGRFREAVDSLREAARLEPFNAMTPHALATAYVELGESDAATEQFLRALELDFGDTRIGVDYARHLVRQGDRAGAYAMLQMVIDRDPLDSMANASVGALLWQGGFRDSGLEFARFAVEVDPTNDLACRLMEWMGSEEAAAKD